MKHFCRHSTSCWIEADTPEDAQAQMCQLVRDNIEPSHISVDEGESAPDEKEDEVTP